MIRIIFQNKFFSVACMCIFVALIIVPVTAVQISQWSKQVHLLQLTKVYNEKLSREFEKQLNLYRGGLEEKAKKLYTVRPSEDQLITFLKTMETMARQSEVRNFSLTNIEMASSNSPSDGPVTLRYVAKFEATPKTFNVFLEAFDGLPYYLAAANFDFQAQDKAPLSEVGDVALIFDLFVR